MKILRLILVLLFVATPLAADDTVRVAAAVLPSDVTSAQKVQLDATSAALLKGDMALAQKYWSDFSADYFNKKEKQAALSMIVDFVMKNGVLPTDPDAPKRSVRIRKKKAVVEGLGTVGSKGKQHLLKLKELRAQNKAAMVSELQVNYDGDGLPSLLPLNEKQMDVAQITLEISEWEGQLTNVHQLSNQVSFDLQNIQQRQQQTLDVMGKTSKMAHEIAMSIIANLK